MLIQSYTRIALGVLALVVVAGCASTEVTERHEYRGGKLPRPTHIWVYDFAASPADVPRDSPLGSEHGEYQAPQTAEQVALGRQVGAAMARAGPRRLRS